MQLAYLLAEAVESSTWAGGLLITDERGLPVDFRYVEPIRPSKLQKLIYGEALKRYLILEAIAGTLIKAAKPEADWVFTSDPLLLEIDSQVQGRFVVIENGQGTSLSGVGEWQVDGPGKLAMQVAPEGPAVNLTFHADGEEATEEIAKDLAWLAERLDFTEPLARVQVALKEICRGGAD